MREPGVPLVFRLAVLVPARVQYSSLSGRLAGNGASYHAQLRSLARTATSIWPTSPRRSGSRICRKARPRGTDAAARIDVGRVQTVTLAVSKSAEAMVDEIRARALGRP